MNINTIQTSMQMEPIVMANFVKFQVWQQVKINTKIV
jgi:hypothetical protein